MPIKELIYHFNYYTLVDYLHYFLGIIALTKINLTTTTALKATTPRSMSLSNSNSAAIKIVIVIKIAIKISIVIQRPIKIPGYTRPRLWVGYLFCHEDWDSKASCHLSCWLKTHSKTEKVYSSNVYLPNSLPFPENLMQKIAGNSKSVTRRYVMK